MQGVLRNLSLDSKGTCLTNIASVANIILYTELKSYDEIFSQLKLPTSLACSYPGCTCVRSDQKPFWTRDLLLYPRVMARLIITAVTTTAMKSHINMSLMTLPRLLWHTHPFNGLQRQSRSEAAEEVGSSLEMNGMWSKLQVRCLPPQHPWITQMVESLALAWIWDKTSCSLQLFPKGLLAQCLSACFGAKPIK